MDYYKRINRIILIALSLSLFLSFLILLSIHIIRNSFSHNITVVENPVFLLKAVGGEKIGPSHRSNDNSKKDKSEPVGKNDDNFIIDNKQSSKVSNDKSVWLLIGLISLFIGFIFLIYFKKKISPNDESLIESNKVHNFKKLSKTNTNLALRTDFPTEEIRKMLINWEIQLPPIKQRKSHETIQQWFTRIGKSDEFIPIYEKVRYGNHELENEEIELVKRFLY